MPENQQQIILDIYDTVADDSLWPGVLDRLADEFGVLGCIIFDVHGEGANRTLHCPYFGANYDPRLVAYYLETFHDQEMGIQDQFERRLSGRDEVEIYTDEFLEGTEAVKRAKPSIEWLASQGLHHRAAGLLDKDNPNRSRFSLQMGAKGGPLDEARIAKISPILPHIAKALELGRPARDLAAAHSGLVSAMDRLRIGMCILDEAGRVVVSNEEFKRQCDTYRELRVDPRGRLAIDGDDNRRRFEALIADALNHGKFGARPRKEAIVTTRDEAVGALCIEVAPLENARQIGAAPIRGAIVYSLDARHPPTINTAVVSRVFDLTPTETELVELIAQGLSNPEMAERRDRALATVNNQVKSVLSKTYCANRTQLVRLLAGYANSTVVGEGGAQAG
jgi:DNA-binding CsgD family transcriptional regulator